MRRRVTVLTLRESWGQFFSTRGEKGGKKGEKKKKGRGRRKGREKGGERRREGILKKINVQNNVHCKHWQPQVAMLTVVCVNG